MELLVVSLSQDVSFEDSSVTNFVILRAPSGHIIRAVVTDESARLLVDNLAAQKTGSPLPPRTAPQVAPPAFQAPSAPARQAFQDDGPVVFGGDPDTEDQPAASMPWLPGANDPPPPSDFVPPASPPPGEYQDVDTQTRNYKRNQRAQADVMKRGGTFNGKHVPKDDAGYPIVAGGQGSDPGELVGGGGAGGADEDGVGQV